jgi:hypothetical protein
MFFALLIFQRSVDGVDSSLQLSGMCSVVSLAVLCSIYALVTISSKAKILRNLEALTLQAAEAT